MTLNTEIKVIKSRLRAMFAPIITTIVLVLILLTNWFDQPVLGLTKSNYAILIIAAYVIFIVYNSLKNNFYIFLSTEKNKLTIRYYSLSLFNNSKKSIEIPLETLHNFKIETKRGGLLKLLTVYQKTNKGVAKYPPISISILDKEELQLVSNTLKKFSKNYGK